MPLNKKVLYFSEKQIFNTESENLTDYLSILTILN